MKHYRKKNTKNRRSRKQTRKNNRRSTRRQTRKNNRRSTRRQTRKTNRRSTRRQTRKTNHRSTRRQTRKTNRRSTRRKINRRYSKRKIIKKNIKSLYGGTQEPEDGGTQEPEDGGTQEQEDGYGEWEEIIVIPPEDESGKGKSVDDEVEDESGEGTSVDESVDVEDGLVDDEVEDEPSTEQHEWWIPFPSMTELNDAFKKMSENKMFFSIFEKPVIYVKEPIKTLEENTIVNIENVDRDKLFEDHGKINEDGEKYVDIFNAGIDLKEIYENVLTHSEKELLKYRYDNMIFIEEKFLKELSRKDEVEARIRTRIKGEYTPVHGNKGLLADPVVMFQWYGKSDKVRDLLPIRLRKLNVERQENDKIKLLNKFYHDRKRIKILAEEDESDERSISSYLSTLNLYEQIIIIKGIVESLYSDGQLITYEEKQDIMTKYNEIYRDEERGKEKYNFDREISKMISEAERKLTDKIKLKLFPETDKKRCKEYEGYEGKITTNKLICDSIKRGEEDLNKLFDKVEINLGGYISSDFTFDDNLFDINPMLIKEIVDDLVEEQYRKTKLFSSLNLDPETKEGREEITIRINQLNSQIKVKIRIKEKTGRGEDEIIKLQDERDYLISLRGENDPEITEIAREAIETYNDLKKKEEAAKGKLIRRLEKKKALIQKDNTPPLFSPNPPISGKKNPRKKPRRKKPKPPTSGKPSTRKQRALNDKAEEIANKIGNRNRDAMEEALKNLRGQKDPLDAW
jgi:hypothetical protein